MAETDNLNPPPAGDELDIELTDVHAGHGAVAPCVHIECDATVRQQIREYAMTDTSRELGGVLIGTVRQQGQPRVQVTAMIIARYTDAHNASVTFTHETWTDILAIKDRSYPTQKIVGWFHTHPGFGIFLSRFDLHIHENFFNLDWQIAYVVDPLAHTEGFFRWEDGKVQKTLDFQIIGEAPLAPMAIPQPAKTVSPLFDWRNAAIVVLLAGVVYLQFFRPQKIILQPQPPVTIPQPPSESTPAPPPVAAIPAPAPAPAPTVSANPVDNWPIYTVQPQDTLWSISQQCYGDGARYKLLVTANKLRKTHSRYFLYTGMKLRVPGGQLPSK